MSPMNRIWILLVQKSTKGPFALSEVSELLDKGVIRRNDLALKIDPDAPKGTGSWKMLWQYEEFDRRREEWDAAEPIPTLAPPKEGDRRNQIDEKEADRLVQEALPIELGEIQPEDLIQRSTREMMRPSDSASIEIFPSDDPRREQPEEAPTPRWVAPVGFLVVAATLFAWGSQSHWWGFSSGTRVSPASSVSPGADQAHISSPSARQNSLSRSVTSSRFQKFAQPPRDLSAPAQDSTILPAQREPEPNRREESSLDKPVEAQKLEGDSGEIPAVSEADSENEAAATPARRKRRAPAKAAVSEEDGEAPPPNENNESASEENRSSNSEE